MKNLLPAPLETLIEQFEKLPGIGKKSAQRLAFAVLRQPEEDARKFAGAIVETRENIRRCKICFNLTDGEICPVCADESRDRGTICVVEDPRYLIAIERTNEYTGLYHVLHGLISPLDGVGPESLYIKELLERVKGGDVREVIVATNANVEGEATSLYIGKLLAPLGVRVSRLAYGLPVGGDLEYADEVTILRAFSGRNLI
ncbi:MAG: recombination mediator RecR [Oscillospiraceae bacterium]|jgi:recombination protein RecR|nr:recombination mediator RecR [Oscillospiraceae bacterium]